MTDQMIDDELERQCTEYLSYLYDVVSYQYPDCDDPDTLIQDSILAYAIASRKGTIIENPKAFLRAILKNKFNDMLRQKYKNSVITFDLPESLTDYAETDDTATHTEEYTAVRRELGRLVRIYREVTVRHYVHGQTIGQIAAEMEIPKGTVLSRLSEARDQIREGLTDMEKYTQISYEPKTVTLGIWGSCGMNGEPFSLSHSEIESNILILAYENPVSVRGIADTMGMPSAYLEPVIDTLVSGELMGRTSGGLVYTRCFMQKYEDSFGDIPVQEALAEKYAKRVWEITWKHMEPLTKRDAFCKMSEKQKATFVLFTMMQMLNRVIVGCRQDGYGINQNQLCPPERPDAGKWLATGTIFEHGQKRNNKYDGSGPVQVTYSKNNDGHYDCQLFDCQSLFGDAHWAYPSFKYHCSMQSILRFYASFLPCDVKSDNKYLTELIPEFEKLHILKRDTTGEIRLDIPALPYPEITEYFDKPVLAMKSDYTELLSSELQAIWLARNNRVPKHIDEPEFFRHSGALGAYTIAQLLAIINKGLFPYPVEIGKTPLIYLAYRPKE